MMATMNDDKDAEHSHSGNKEGGKNDNSIREKGSGLVAGHVPTNPSLGANHNLTQPLGYRARSGKLDGEN